MRLQIHEIPAYFANEGKQIKKGTILRLLRRGDIKIEEDGTIDVTPITTMSLAELDGRVSHGFYAKANNKVAPVPTKVPTKRKPASQPADLTSDTYTRLCSYANSKKLFVDAQLIDTWRVKSEKVGWSLEDAVNLMIDRQWRGIESRYLTSSQPLDSGADAFLEVMNG